MAGGKGQPAAVDTLLRLLASKYYLARTVTGEPFAAEYAVPSVMVRLRGANGLRQRLAADYFEATGGTRGASSNALADLINTAEGMALARKPATPHLRVARHGDLVYLDLGRASGEAVELGAGGWRVVARPPVLFARTALSSELPVPIEGQGSLDVVRGLFNVGGAGEWALMTACRIASLFPGITHPVELVTGPAGSAKTTVTRLLADWMDPAPAMMPVPRDGRTWAAMAGSRYVQPVDNVSWIPVWWSDLLCKAASGDGWVDRALYTDGDIFVAAFQSVIILNGIGVGALRGDLADRIVHHKLARPAAGYVSDEQVAAVWKAAHGCALAWLLDRAAETMADMRHVGAMGTSRLVTFQQIVSCVDRRWGTRAGQVWAEGRHDVLADVAEGDDVAMAVRQAFAMAAFHGTSSELVNKMAMVLPAAERGHTWTPRLISERVERCSGALEALGWRIWRTRTHGERAWHIVPPGVNGQRHYLGAAADGGAGS